MRWAADGMMVSEFDDFGPTRKTLFSFTDGYQALIRVIRQYLLPGVA